MRYALLNYSPATAEDYSDLTAALSKPGTPPGEWGTYTRQARQAGVLVAAEQLSHSETATSVRFDAGSRLVTDGPFMETKGNLLGYYLIDVDRLDDALDWAQRMPGNDGHTVEVRAVLSGLPWQREL